MPEVTGQDQRGDIHVTNTILLFPVYMGFLVSVLSHLTEMNKSTEVKSKQDWSRLVCSFYCTRTFPNKVLNLLSHSGIAKMYSSCSSGIYVSALLCQEQMQKNGSSFVTLNHNVRLLQHAQYLFNLEQSIINIKLRLPDCLETEDKIWWPI